MRDAAYLGAAKAQEVYEAIARGGQTKILAYTGRPAVLVPSVAGRALERILSIGLRDSAPPEEILVDVRGYPDAAALASKYARLGASRRLRE